MDNKKQLDGRYTVNNFAHLLAATYDKHVPWWNEQSHVHNTRKEADICWVLLQAQQLNGIYGHSLAACVWKRKLRQTSLCIHRFPKGRSGNITWRAAYSDNGHICLETDYWSQQSSAQVADKKMLMI